MTCETQETLIAHLDGQLTSERAAVLAEHVGSCTRCKGEQNALGTLVQRLHALEPLADSSFVSDVLQAIEPKPARRLRFMPVLGLAACALVAVFVVPRSGEFVARGGSVAAKHALGFEAFASGAPLAANAKVANNAGFTFVVYNRSHEPRYFMLYARDHAGELHWFAPSYDDATDNPQSLPLLPSAQGQRLAVGTVLETPALGELQVIALFTAKPVSVHEVERGATFADAVVETLPVVLVQP